MANISYGWLKDYNNNEFIPITHSAKVFNDNGISVESRLLSAESLLQTLNNQKAFKNIKIGTTTIAADLAEDTIEIVAGSGITIASDATNDKITISHKDESSATSVTTSTGGTPIIGLSIDAFGHVTKITTGTDANLTIGNVVYNGSAAKIVDLTNFGLTASATELNYIKGVTSAVQTQINNKSKVTIVRWS